MIKEVVHSVEGLDSSSGCVFSSCTNRTILCDSLGQAFILKSDSGEIKLKDDSLYNDVVSAVCLDVSGDEVAIACNNAVNIHSFPEIATVKASMVCRSTLPISCLQYDPSASNIFVGSKAPGIKVYSKAIRKVVLTIDTYEVGIRSFSVSPCGGFLAAINEAGAVTVYRLNSTSEGSSRNYNSYDMVTQVSNAVSLDAVRDASMMGCLLSWHPTLTQVAIPYKKGFVLLLTAGEAEWTETHLVPSSELNHADQDLAMAMFSPNGSQLVSADVRGRLLLWSTTTQDPLRVLHEGPGVLLGMSWSDAVQLLTPSGIVHITISSAPATDESQMTQLDTQIEPAPTAPAKRLQKSAAPSATYDDDDISLDGNTQPAAAAGAEDPLTESVTRIRREVFGDVDASAMDVVDDAVPEEEPEQEPVAYAPYVSPIELQPTFQPASTVHDDYQRRYLVWNQVGYITSRDEGATNRIEIKFSNTSGKNKQETFPDHHKFSLASLSYEGAIFATELTEPEPSDAVTQPGSIVYYHAFPRQTVLEGANEEFTLNLLPEEGAVAVAVGKGWCAVATTRGYLRLFSSTGLQIGVFVLSGPAVSLVGSGCRLAVVYHRATPIEETPQLQTEIFEFSLEGKSRLVTRTPLALTPRAVLTWIGFDTSGVLHYMDSAGTLCAVMNVASWQCIPVLETALIRKSVDHVYWPVCIKTSRLIYVLLNGETKPAVYPQPITSTKPYHVPVLDMEGLGKEKDEMNEKNRVFSAEYMRRCHVDAEKEEALVTGAFPYGLNADEYEAKCEEMYQEADKAALKVFIDACRLQRNAVAADIAKKLVLETSIEAAILAANHYGRAPIAQLLSDIKEYKASLRLQEAEHAEQYDARPATAPAAYDDNFQYPVDENQYDNSQKNQPLFRNKSINANAVVSPEPSSMSLPVNPFAAMNSTPSKKRKNAVESIKDIRGSPSPKKPIIARESPFAQQARQKQLDRKVVI